MSEHTEFKVESGVPIPRNGSHASLKFPWPQMRPGDSFIVRCTKAEETKVQRNMVASGYGWLKRHRPDCRVVTRAVDGGVRVWLVSRNGKP